VSEESYRLVTAWDERSETSEDNGNGSRRPSKTSRSTKGLSENPTGRPRRRNREALYEAVPGQILTIRGGRIERKPGADEAFLLKLGKPGIEGDVAAARECLAMIEEDRRQ
jgi:Family of unknown function (DUF5681)